MINFKGLNFRIPISIILCLVFAHHRPIFLEDGLRVPVLNLVGSYFILLISKKELF
jgi:hypothetical protein